MDPDSQIDCYCDFFSVSQLLIASNNFDKMNVLNIAHMLGGHADSTILIAQAMVTTSDACQILGQLHTLR